MRKEDDYTYLIKALILAKKGEGQTRPNPPVGAIIVKRGEIIGKGYHTYAGVDHAEVVAIKSCKVSPKGATLYVTLEPCSTSGRVSPCTKAIIDAGIKRVVYASADPNPLNHNQAKRVLEKAGVICEQHEFTYFFDKLIAPFAKLVKTGIPFVTVKLAMSLDGKICDNEGNSKWITCDASRITSGCYRRECDAIMVGAETIRKDNPSLLWHEGTNDNLIRVVISKSGRLPKNAQVFTDGKNETLVFKSPEAALKALGKRGCLHVICEGGMKLAISLAKKGLVDVWENVIASIVIADQPLAKAIRIKDMRCLPDLYTAPES